MFSIKSLYFYEKQPTYLSGFRKRGAEKRARPTGASGQPIRKENLSDFFLKKQPTYLSGFRKRRAEKRARPTGASGQPIGETIFREKNSVWVFTGELPRGVRYSYDCS